MYVRILSFFGFIVLGFIFSSSKILAVADNVKPEISNIRVDEITVNSARIRWETNEFSTSFVDYYTPSTNGGFPTIINAGQGDNTKSHRVSLSNLTSGKKYYFRVISNDPAGNEAQSAYSSFTTNSLLIPNIKTTIPSITILTITPSFTPEPTQTVTPSPTSPPNEIQSIQEQTPTIVIPTQVSSENSQIEEITPSPTATEPQKTTFLAGIQNSPSNIIGILIIVLLIAIIAFLLIKRKRKNKSTPEKKTHEEETSRKETPPEKPHKA